MLIGNSSGCWTLIKDSVFRGIVKLIVMMEELQSEDRTCWMRRDAFARARMNEVCSFKAGGRVVKRTLHRVRAESGELSIYKEHRPI